MPPPPPPPPPAAANAANDADADTTEEAPLPTIDLASYADDAQSLARDLRHACETVGFFFLENHGIAEEVFARAFDAGRRFFALPDDQKRRCRATQATKNRGWTPLEAETLDPAHQRTRGDLKEGFYVGREIKEDGPMAGLPLHGPNVWPDEQEDERGGDEEGSGGGCKGCRGFRAACEDYHAAMTGLARRLLPAVAEAALGGGKDAAVDGAAAATAAFVDAVFGEHGGASGSGGGGEGAGGAGAGAPPPPPPPPVSSGPMAFMRLLQYAPVASEVRDDDSLLGCGAHSDWGMLTFLATDGSPGLQVRRRRRRRRTRRAGAGAGESGDGAIATAPTETDSESYYYWQDVPARPFPTLIVNVGDMLERWTGGRLKSTVHRVVVTAAQAERGHRRQSIAFFLDPSFSALIKPEAGGGGEEYAPVRAGEYLLQRYRETHAGFAA
jgi:isopenicillin N synthase-like dioxygenase